LVFRIYFNAPITLLLCLYCAQPLNFDSSLSGLEVDPEDLIEFSSPPEPAEIVPAPTTHVQRGSPFSLIFAAVFQQILPFLIIPGMTLVLYFLVSWSMPSKASKRRVIIRKPAAKKVVRYAEDEPVARSPVKPKPVPKNAFYILGIYPPHSPRSV